MASDATLLTSGSGDLEAHPLMITLDNIDSATRRNLSNHAFLLLALLPKPKFTPGLHKDIARCLRDRILHSCLRIILKPLFYVAKHGKLMSDPRGRLRQCFTLLSMYSVDYPEAVKLAGVTYNTSPVSVADGNTLGEDSAHDPRWAKDTLASIEKIKENVDPSQLKQFAKYAAKHYNLSGVHELFWADWDQCEPSVALCFDLLHSTHKFWKDHPFKWAKAAMGVAEIDKRYKALHPRIGSRHFGKGVASLSKTGGKDHRDMQRYFLCVIDGAVPSKFVAALRAQLDYSYLAQSTEVSESDVEKIEDLLQEFHANKGIVHEKGYRTTEGWKIPKLELQYHIIRTLISLGCLLGLSTDISEHAHIILIKEPFRRTNHKDFFIQMVLFLDRLERLRHFDIATALKNSGLADKLKLEGRDLLRPQHELESDRNLNASNDSAREDLDLGWLEDLETIQNLRGGKRPEYRDYFEVVKTLRQTNLKDLNRIRTFQPTGFTAIHLNRDPSISSMAITDAAELFDIPDLHDSIREHFYFESLAHLESNQRRQSGPVLARRSIPAHINFTLDFQKIRIWFSIKVQTRSLLEPGHANKAETIMAEPSSEGSLWPLGRHDCALFFNDQDKPFEGRANLQGKIIHLVRYLRS